MSDEISEEVREILEPLADQYITCRRVLEYLEGERPAWKVKTNDYLRVLEASEGKLALDLSGSNTGAEQYGYDPDRKACPYDVWIFSQINADLGDRPPEWTDTTTKRGLKHTLEDRHCGVILRSESNLAEDEDGEDGDAAAVAMTDGGQGVFCSDHPRAGVKARSQQDMTGNPVTEYRCMDCGRPIDERPEPRQLRANGGEQQIVREIIQFTGDRPQEGEEIARIPITVEKDASGDWCYEVEHPLGKNRYLATTSLPSLFRNYADVLEGVLDTDDELRTDGGTRLANDGGLQCRTCGASVDPMHAYRCENCGRDLVGDGEGSR